ncbi:HD domain-containing protein [uncultured Microscilla sp.]|uniref:HD domain-containing protein n=1 Tax=uncultured Microscilla sp. TaxID=432653 RepID=UPI00262E9375|nr:HD domain-containing protein [uncultured Microscilla sp.]
MWNQSIYLKAIEFAGDAHIAQKIPGSNRSYTTHLARVAMEVMTAWVQSPVKFDADYALQCALLHDTIEDTKVTYAQVAKVFGQEVADGVMALTKNDQLPGKEAQMEDSLRRILRQRVEVRMVKMCDRIDNLSEPPYYWDSPKKHRYQQEARVILNTLQGVNPYIEQRLQEKIDHYSTYINEA